jgi:hypothetical protein
MSKFKIGGKVKHPCDSGPFEVVGVRKNGQIEIEGDCSGGTYPCNASDWVDADQVEEYDQSKVVYYVDGVPYKNGIRL